MNNLTLTGGSVLTLDAGDTFYETGFVEIAGRAISDIGPYRHSHQGELLDVSRCVVLPGFINAHTHLFITMWRGLDDNLALFPWLQALSPAIGLMNEEDMVQSNYAGCMESILSGTTTVCECCRYDPQITARVAAGLGLRCIAGGMPASEWFGVPLPTDLPRLAENTRSIVSNPEDYSGLARAHLGAHSPYNCSPEFIVATKGLADDLGVPFNIHLAECREEIQAIGQRYGKTPVQHLHNLGVLGPGMIADHCVWFSDEDMELFLENGAGVVHNPVSNAKLHSGVAPVGRYLELGIPVGLATDSVVSNNSLNMFKEMQFGLLMQRNSPTPNDSQRLTALDYLRMATIGSATVLGMDGIIGSIEPGKRADLIVVQLPPELPATYDHIVSHLVWSAGPQDLRLVMVDGRIIARDGRLEYADGPALRQEVTAYFESRWKQLGPQLASV